MEKPMASLPKLVVILAIVILPSRLLGQFGEPREPEPAPQPASAVAVPPPEQEAQPHAADHTERHTAGLCDSFDWRRSLANFVRINDTPACGPPRQSLFVFGGLLTKGSMGDTLDIFNVTYDGNYVIALGYQRYHWSTGKFHWGWEVGVAGRYGHEHSMEFWGGPTVRHDGITLFNFLRISPALTAGFSMVTDTMGQEVHRERARDGDGTFLYYLGPDFAASLTSHPNIEFFYRLHHRCGGGQTLGNLSEGYNANVVGLRIRF